MQTTTFLTDQQSQKTHYVVARPTTTTTKKPPVSADALPETTPAELPPDAREQLFNGGEIGPFEHIQVSTARIVKLNGILFDIDPHNLRERPPCASAESRPARALRELPAALACKSPAASTSRKCVLRDPGCMGFSGSIPPSSLPTTPSGRGGAQS